MNTLRANCSVIIITRNEERNIEACLESVAWADDVVVVDASSTDRTVERARKYTPSVIVREWLGFAEAKNVALEHVKHTWVMWLDADERVPPELAAEIRSIVEAGRYDVAAYAVARRAYFLGKWIRHCGWYPGYVVRLFRRDRAVFTTSSVHESLVVNGRVDRLKHDLLHFTDENLFHYFSKFNRYTTLASEDLHRAGRRCTAWDLISRPPFLFFKMYIVRAGFLDGVHGFVLSLLSTAYVMVKYAKLWELQRASQHARITEILSE
jgi:glycosyltransferase involved in cell wall biosynthesis